MDNNAEQKRAITRYLLGEMAEQERSEFEDRYIGDSSLFEELVAVEDEMMRSYARGSLSEPERLAFEARFLKNQGSRRRVDFAKSLMNFVLSQNEDADFRDHSRIAARPHSVANEPKRKWQDTLAYGPGARSSFWIIAAAMVLLLIGGGLLAVQYAHVVREFKQMQAQHDGDLRREQELHQQLEKLTDRLRLQKQQFTESSSDSTVLSVTLSPHLIRQSSPQEPLIIRDKFSAVLLQLTLRDDAFQNYTASLETPEGHKIWQQSGLKSWQTGKGVHLIAVVLPSTILKNGSYILTLSSMTKGKSEEIDSYIFHILRE